MIRAALERVWWACVKSGVWPVGKGELKVRLIFGPAMLALVGLIFWVDHEAMIAKAGVLSAIVLGLLAVAAVREYVGMMRGAGHPVSSVLLTSLTVGLCGCAPWLSWQTLDRELYPLAAATMILLYSTVLRSLSRDRVRHGLEEQGATLLGFIMIVWPLYLAQGMAMMYLPALLYVIAICKGGDIGGYMFGIAFGRHKLIPHVSAGKTIEGSVGSMLVSCVLAVLLAGPLLPETIQLGWASLIGIGILLNVLTQTGDLAESLLKRRCGVKDSSRLLPAHGGILDLIDSLLFSFPAFFLMLVLVT